MVLEALEVLEASNDSGGLQAGYKTLVPTILDLLNLILRTFSGTVANSHRSEIPSITTPLSMQREPINMVAKNASIGLSPPSISAPPRTPDGSQGNVSATQSLPTTERRVKDMSNDELTTYLQRYKVSSAFVDQIKEANLTGSAFARG